MKTCSDCKSIKSFSDFYFQRRDNRYSRRCKPCDIKRIARWKLYNASPIPAAYRRYNLSKEEYESLINKSGGQCEICWREYGKPFVDHDAKTGKVRGILCMECNFAIGLLLHDPDIIRRAADYLGRFEPEENGDN